MKKPNKRILIVEDDAFLGDLCEKKLKSENYLITSTRNGQEGYDKAVRLVPDLILLDLIIPQLDGFKVLEKIRSHEDEKISKIPIMILSNLGQERDIERAKDLGANGFLIKANYTMGQVAKKIKGYLK